MTPVTPRESNWAGNVTYSAARLHRPTTPAELQQIVAHSDRAHALGTRHSFNRVADTAGDLIDVTGLPVTIEVDSGGRQVRVSGGTTYGELATRLHTHGLALPNLGSLPHISVAGACATGTHGSGDAGVNGHMLMAWRVDAFRDLEEFKRDMDEMLADLVARSRNMADVLRAVNDVGAQLPCLLGLRRRTGQPIALLVDVDLRHVIATQHTGGSPRREEPAGCRVGVLAARGRGQLDVDGVTLVARGQPRALGRGYDVIRRTHHGRQIGQRARVVAEGAKWFELGHLWLMVSAARGTQLSAAAERLGTVPRT